MVSAGRAFETAVFMVSGILFGLVVFDAILLVISPDGVVPLSGWGIEAFFLGSLFVIMMGTHPTRPLKRLGFVFR